ncbi:MAG: hypothetical protein HY530_00045 [Chloroflexi bacterium]|nr:hypothetical protein [Chloroflexota bacterium]
MKRYFSVFPLPHTIGKEKIDGSFMSWPKACKRCLDGSCFQASKKEMKMCSYGYNSIRITDDIVTGGFVVRETGTFSQARKRRLREATNLISIDNLNHLIESMKNLESDFASTIELEKREIIEEYKQKEQYKLAFLEPLKENIAKGLSFFHDYRQINAQILQNINVAIETKYKGKDFEEKLEQASNYEITIYKASKLLEEKLNVARLLMNPYLINNKNEYIRFRVHVTLPP